ncbi:hypothetical protein BGX26_006976, partial [Mortierella sp. AD094]
MSRMTPPSISSALTRSSSSGTEGSIIQLHSELTNLANNHYEVSKQILRNQAEAKERDLEVFRMLVESKEREIELLKKQLEHKEMLQQAHDRMVILQQGIDAVLVQNYELHEYPIPRLFVILPEKIASKVIRDIEDSRDGTESSISMDEGVEDQEGFIDMIKSWDPRQLLEEKFRLYFLCECGEHSSAGPSTENCYTRTSTQPTTNTKNKVHLAKHKGYQLSKPTQFLEQYGPYVLGMLQILKFCLDAAKAVAPVVGLAGEGLKKAVDSVKSASEHALDAVNISINFLEMKLGSDITFDALDGNSSGEDIFKNLAALEGADLRQLETFLHNKDKDKILGNLYRTTTPKGHVKWVCLEHFKTSYRENAARSLLNTIEVNHGHYDKQLGKITLVLSSSIVAKDFMKQLITYS